MMIIISTNPVTAEPRRKINNGKEEHLCWAEPQQRVYTRLRSSSSEKHSYIEREKGKRKAYLDLIGQHVKLFHTCCSAFCSQRFLLKEHFYSNTSPAISKAKSSATLKNIMLAKQTYIFNCFLQVHRGTLLTSAIAKKGNMRIKGNVWWTTKWMVATPGDKWDAEFNFEYIQFDVGASDELCLRFALVCETLKWLGIGLIPIIKMYRMTAKFKDIFKKSFFQF